MAVRLNLHRRQLRREQRDDLIVRLLRDMEQHEVAQLTGVSQSTVSNIFRTRIGTERLSDNDDTPEPEADSFAPGEREAIEDTVREARDGELPPESLDEAIAGNLESKQLPEPEPWLPAKPDLGDGVSHPARYSRELIPDFAKLLRAHAPGNRVLDPFAGTGRIHELHPEFDTVGVEIEPEWADLHDRTICASALDLPFDVDEFDAIVTSPTYGNRLADSHNASDPERRRSYTHDLGRPLAVDNSGGLHWRNGTNGSTDYRMFHEKAWDEAVLALKPGGVFILNIKDHWRGGQLMPVGNWHCWCLGRLGLDHIDSVTVDTGSLRQGANGELRSVEEIYVFGKPS